MENQTITIIVVVGVVILLVGGILIAYKMGAFDDLFTSPEQPPYEEKNLLVEIYNNKTKTSIISSIYFTLYDLLGSERRIIKKGQLTPGFNQIKITNNTIYWVTIFNNEYYKSTAQTFPFGNTQTQQIRVYVDPIEYSPKITTLIEDQADFKVLRVSISSADSLRDVIICFAWTYNYIIVEPFNAIYTETRPPQRHILTDKCYDVHRSIRNETVPFDFRVVTTNLTEADKLNIFIIDRELDEKSELVAEDKDFNDVASMDTILMIEQDR